MDNKEIIDLRTIETILDYKPYIENNPFSGIDKDVLEEAYKLLLEHAEEI